MPAEVYPISDLRNHRLGCGGKCWCNPVVYGDGEQTVIIHNSADGREAFETGERKPS